MFVMLTGFDTLTATSSDTLMTPQRKAMGIAGLMAWSDDWIALADKWRSLQRDEKAPTFHMVDFVHHNEDFSHKRWESEEKRKRILSALLRRNRRGACSTRSSQRVADPQRKAKPQSHLTFLSVRHSGAKG